MMLAKYDAACRAIAAARSVDEARKIRDGAAALRAYAKQAKNKQLEIDSVEIRVRAERRVGELMRAQRETVGLARPGKHRVIGTKTDPIKKPPLAKAGIDKHLAQRARKLAAMPPKKFEADLAAWRKDVEQPQRRVTTNVVIADRGKYDVHFSSEKPEHYTPPEFLEAVCAVFGGAIDLDPCSNPGQPNVKARQRYTVAENGLLQPWAGRVFMNPPYGREIGAWIEKLRNEWRRGEVDEAIALLPARTDTEWFEALTTDTGDLVVCFVRGRLVFVGNEDVAPFPSLAAYFGPKQDVFVDVFDALGSLWQRPPRPREWFINHESIEVAR